MKAKFKHITTALIIMALIGTASAAEYYVAGENPDCSDLGTGNESKPWCTIQKAADVIGPGDTVYVRQGTYHEELTLKNSGTDKNYITFAAYPGEEPVLDGSIVLTGWTACESMAACENNPNWQNIHYSFVPGELKYNEANLHEDNVYLPLAQDPNQPDDFYIDQIEYFNLIPTAGYTKTTIADPGYFNQTDKHYWDGASVLVWGGNNAMNEKKILDFIPGENKIVFEELLIDPLPDHDRYSILNHISALDRPGEYYFDKNLTPSNEHKIYLWPRNPDSLWQGKVTVSTLETGIKIMGKSYIIIDGFHVKKYSSTTHWEGEGIINKLYFTANNVIVRNNKVSNNYADCCGGLAALYIGGCTDCLVENNEVYDNHNRGIMAPNVFNTMVRGNTIWNCTGTGIFFQESHDSIIEDNFVFENLGHHSNGISVYQNSSDILVKGNTVINSNMAFTNSCSDRTTLEGNIFSEDGGARLTVFYTGCPNSGHKIIGNTLVNAENDIALFIGDAQDVIIRNNIIDGLYDETENSEHSYNLYTSLFWNQQLEEGEVLEEDLGNIFVNSDSDNFNLLPSHLVGTPPSFGDPCFMSSTSSYVGALACKGCIDSSPLALFTVNKTYGYEPLDLEFNASNSLSCNSTITNYSWNFGDGITAQGKTATHTYSKGTHEVSLTVVNSLGNSNTSKKTINVLPSLIPNLVMFIDFEGNVFDLSGKNNHGTWQGSESYGQGIIGQAASLDGTSDGSYVIVDIDETLEGMDQLTLSAWVKKNNANVGGIIFLKHAIYFLSVESNSIYYYLFNSLGKRINITPTTELVNDTDWHHHAMTYDGNTIKVYLDGREIALEPFSGSIAVSTSTRSLYIGKNPWGNSFNGAIDKVRIYDRGLTGEEILTLYNEPSQECINLTALTDYISEWKQGNLGIATLMQKIAAWKTGTGC